MIGPFLKSFGSKWAAARRGVFPVPEHSVIFEPFAGGAGYSCAHCINRVVLYDAHDELRELWQWLVSPAATESVIRSIPILEPETNILEAGLDRGPALLVKWWQRTNNHGCKTWKVSPWGNKPGQWTESTRSRIAEQVQAIKHWEVLDTNGSMADYCSATVFVDPPYELNYQYGFKPGPDFYSNLSETVRDWERQGCQVIVCEAVGKTGQLPTWLPFRSSHRQVTSRRKASNHHHSAELLYTTPTSPLR